MGVARSESHVAACGRRPRSSSIIANKVMIMPGGAAGYAGARAMVWDLQSMAAVQRTAMGPSLVEGSNG